MSIIQEALKKAQGDYVEKKISPKIEILTPRRLKKTVSLRLPVLVSMLTALILIYGLQSSLQYSRTSARPIKAPDEVKVTSLPPPAVKAAKPIDMPKPAVITPVTVPVSAFVLNGIMYMEKRPQAIINGYVLEEGDKINDATVTAIEEDCVLLKVNDADIKLRLGK